MNQNLTRLIQFCLLTVSCVLSSDAVCQTEKITNPKTEVLTVVNSLVKSHNSGDWKTYSSHLSNTRKLATISRITYLKANNLKFAKRLNAAMKSYDSDLNNHFRKSHRDKAFDELSESEFIAFFSTYENADIYVDALLRFYNNGRPRPRYSHKTGTTKTVSRSKAKTEFGIETDYGILNHEIIRETIPTKKTITIYLALIDKQWKVCDKLEWDKLD